MTSADPVYVVAGALVDPRGRVLIAQRPAGKAFAGRWEFPGGKKLAHETPRDALNRELLEELGVQVARARPLLKVRHRYSEAAPPVLIDCWVVDGWRGEIAPLDGQQLRWCEREELPAADILEADRAIVTALRLPATFVRVDAPDTLATRLPGPRGRERVAWIVPELPGDLAVVRRLREHGDFVFVLDPPAPPGEGIGSVYASAHATSHPASRGALVGRVVSGGADVRTAVQEGADFLLVPERALDAGQLAELEACGLPFYVNVATPGAVPAAATGKLWWKPPASAEARGDA